MRRSELEKIIKDSTTVGDLVRQLREQSNHTVRSMSKSFNHGESYAHYISGVENSYYMPSLNFLKKYITYYQIKNTDAIARIYSNEMKKHIYKKAVKKLASY